MKITLCDRCRKECPSKMVAGQKFHDKLDVCDHCREDFNRWWAAAWDCASPEVEKP